MAEAMEVDAVLPQSYRDIPIHALRQTVRRKLSLYLNIENLTIPGEILPDFNGLAELIDFDYVEIQNFRQQRNPTEAILQEWQQRPNLKPTVGKLVECLTTMGREDILTDCMPIIVADIKSFINRKTQFENSEPIQDPSVTSSPPVKIHDDRYVDETLVMTVQDVQKGSPQFYDAFVCYDPDGQDLSFVKEMLKVLEAEPYNLRFFVPWRDDLPGSATHTVNATLIKDRCKRMVIIMSYKYLISPSCDFQTKFAHSLSPGSRSKKLVPVLIESCEIPHILRHVTLCDYTKLDLKEWFWDRLHTAIKAPINPAELEFQGDLALSDISLDVSTGSENLWQSSSSSCPPTSSVSSHSSRAATGTSSSSPATEVHPSSSPAPVPSVHCVKEPIVNRPVGNTKPSSSPSAAKKLGKKLFGSKTPSS